MDSAGDMPLAVEGAARLVTAPAGIDDAQARIGEMGGEPVCINQGGQIDHRWIITKLRAEESLVFKRYKLAGG
jgi:hypothetical protein